MLAAMGEDEEQRPAVMLEGSFGAAVDGCECWVNGFWKTGTY